MDKYQFEPKTKSGMESSPIPFAVYQIIGQQVKTLILSAGFCELFGISDREEAYRLMDSDPYHFLQPEDVARVAKADCRFATEGGSYNIVYRIRPKNRDGLVIIHAKGKIVTTETGARLAYVWHSDEGQYSEGSGESQDDLNRSYNRILREGAMIHENRYDALTGLPNMTWFFELAEAGAKKMMMKGTQPAVVFLDFCGMKAFNSKWGFAEGDRLIRDFALLLSEQFGDKDCSRFGQDHFAVLTTAEGVDKRLSDLFVLARNLGGRSLPVRAGICLIASDDFEIGKICDRAKMACDLNRTTQISRFRYFHEKMLADAEKKQYIIDNLDRALASRWIQVYYQAIIRTTDGKVCDEEALSRWIDPVRGFLSPADFIPALEESRLIYKLDLYVVERVLEKMKRQEEVGLYLVPQSVNLSRVDFSSCDIVEEICRRVDESGIDRSMLNIEVTESVVGRDFDFMKQQIKRFRELGFRVWMDDFGSGYSSLDVLQQIHFDLLKFDMRFMERFNSGDEGKIILTELTRMAISLGVETVCEGVEQKAQVEFLREIGCTKIQGYYYGKPIPFDEILALYHRGVDMGFENPEEADYYASIGRINLYDMSVLVSEDEVSLNRYFNTLPMAILEVSNNSLRYSRCNRSYRDFMYRLFRLDFTTENLNLPEVSSGGGGAFLSAVLRCCRDGNLSILNEPIDEKTTIHSFIRRVAVNPVTGTAAIAIAVLAVVEEESNSGTNYANISRALSSDYINLYYVDTETDQFIEYTSDPSRENLAVERHGSDFFNSSAKDARIFIYKNDRDYFIESFSKENVLRAIDEHGTFTLTYRLLIDETPTYVNMKAVRMQMSKSHIIIGISNVDAQLRQKEEMERLREEQITYSRINALSRGYICIYTIDPATDHYFEYTATRDYDGLGLPKEGDDFFAAACRESVRHVIPEDIEKFQTMLTHDRILEEIEKNGVFSMQYRMFMDGEPIYVMLSAALIEEQDGPQLIIGINNINAQIRREQDYERKLAAARSRANLDTLTGVKNRTAYDSMSKSLSRQIAGGQSVKYAIALCRVNELEKVNEERGHEAGDQLIRDACAIICNVFKHSPVFRVTGDQFAAVAQGHDYECADELEAQLEEISRRNQEEGGVVISCGLAKYDGTGSVAAVFARADELCHRKTEN